MIVTLRGTDSEDPVKRSTSSKVCKLSRVSLGLLLAEGALCAPPHDPEMVKYVNDAIDIMEQHSIYRNRISWPDLRELLFESTEELTELSHAHAAIENALQSIGDRRGRLMSPEQLDPLINDGVGSTRLSPWTPVEAKLIGDRIGYVTVPNLIGRNDLRTIPYVDEMHEAIKGVDSDDVCAWIVDLRDTSAGNILAMLAGIRPILGSSEAGGQIDVDHTIYPRRIENSLGAYRLRNRNPPVAVLIGHETSGSGEATALAFVGREMSLTFGEPTAGLTTGTWVVLLSDGYLLVLSRSIMTDRIDRPFLDGIQPQVRASENEIVDVAAEWLGFSDPCH